MFRQEEVILGGWHEKTMEAMQRRRFEQMAARLPPLGAQRLESLGTNALQRRIEQSWQAIERKPTHRIQLKEIREKVLSCVVQHADCLSRDEHDLLDRALILGGSAAIRDAQELEAAQALSLRLWANVGLVSGQPVLELERSIMKPAAAAIERSEHEHIRARFEEFTAHLSGLLYLFGAIDDKAPQQTIVREVLGGAAGETGSLLARRFLWSSCDCVDYGGGVMLVHPALAEPHAFLSCGRRKPAAKSLMGALAMEDILPEEIPLQNALERTIDGALRDGQAARDVARDIRFLCKQGAPLQAMQDVLQSSLIVLLSAPMHGALEQMYYMTPKWITCAQSDALQ